MMHRNVDLFAFVYQSYCHLFLKCEFLQMDDDDDETDAKYQRRIESIKLQDYKIIQDECSHEEREWVDPLFGADASSKMIR